MGVSAPELVKDEEFEHLHPRNEHGEFSLVGAALHALARDLGEVVHHEEIGEPNHDYNSHGVMTLHADGTIAISSIDEEGVHGVIAHGGPEQAWSELTDSISQGAEDAAGTGDILSYDYSEEFGHPLDVSFGTYGEGNSFVALDREENGLSLDPASAQAMADKLQDLREIQRSYAGGDPTVTRPLPTGEHLERRKVFGNDYGEYEAVAGLVSTPDGPRVRLGAISAAEGEARRWTGGRGQTTVDLDRHSAAQVADVLEEFAAAGRERQKVYDRHINAAQEAEDAGKEVDYNDVSSDVRMELGGDFEDDFTEKMIDTPWGTVRLTDVGMDDEANGHHWHTRVEIWPAGMTADQYDRGQEPTGGPDWAWPGSKERYQKPEADLSAKNVKALVKLLRQSFSGPDGQEITKSEGASTMDTTLTYAWAPITKSVKQTDGTLIVYGPASDAGLDRDGQRMSQEWLDRAMPRWQAEGGNIREQHDPKRAVGVSVGLAKDDSSGAWNVAGHIVDPVAVKKVETGVLKGYSIGIKEPRLQMGKAEAPNGEVVDGYICELSLADRPSNPRMLFTIAKADSAEAGLAVVENPALVEDAWADDEPDGTKVDEPDAQKRDFTASQRSIAAKSGAAMPDESFPIYNATDLKNAIHLVGNAKDPAAAKAHIVSRARTLGLTTQLPDGWTSDTSEKTDAAAYIAKTIVAVLPDLVKTELAKLGITPQTSPASSGEDTPDLVKTAVAEAIKGQKERESELLEQLEALKADMAAKPMPGGPAIQRTNQQAPSSTDTTQLRHEAQQLLAKADATQDRRLKAGYWNRAQELLAKADGA